MMKFIAAYGFTALVFAALDFIWLSVVGPKLYRPVIGEILADKVRMGPAIVFYLLYVAGIVFFAVLPALEAGKLSRAALNGAVLGLVAYATYDLTNQATLKVWATRLTLADLAWGIFATTAAAGLGYWLTRAVVR